MLSHVPHSTPQQPEHEELQDDCPEPLEPDCPLEPDEPLGMLESPGEDDPLEPDDPLLPDGELDELGLLLQP